MKLQHLIVIFIVIALPVILILAAFVSYQVDTAELKAKYTSKLVGAVHDTVVTFQLNTTNNKYSTVSDQLVRDVEASIKTFTSSLSSNLGMSGNSGSYAMSYIPALVFTLYDGYYIYTPVAGEDGTFTHSLKPYVYYTKEYINPINNVRIVINYSLDNYVAVYFFDVNNEIYYSRAGYLEVMANNESDNVGLFKNGAGKITYNGVEIPNEEELTEDTYSYSTVTVGGKTYVDHNTWSPLKKPMDTDPRSPIYSAYNYYSEAYEFTKWYNDMIDQLSMDDKAKLKITKSNLPYQDETSAFNDEKYNVIRDSITKNLVQAMHTFGKYADYEFQMPQFSGTDWDTIANNVCVIAFMQGMPCGTTIYNNYVILSSTENEQYNNENDIYYVGFDTAVGYYSSSENYMYHRIGCEYLKGPYIVRI